jgi:hypothetical protein
MIQFSVLTCADSYARAVKVFRFEKTEKKFHEIGRIIVGTYFKFNYREFNTLDDFAKIALGWLITQERSFIIRGQLIPGLPPCPCAKAPPGSYYRRILGTPTEPASIECSDRNWLGLDLDDVEVPYGLGAPDKLVEAAYHTRDHRLPSYFRSVRCVVTATAKSGLMLKGPGVARFRLYFLLSRSVANELLLAWAEALHDARPDLGLDPSVFQPYQPIFTGRPIFRGCSDPVPEWGRVRLLDGSEESIDVEAMGLPKAHKPRAARMLTREPPKCADIPDWLLEATTNSDGWGVRTIVTSLKAKKAIKRVFQKLDGCGRPGKEGDVGRNKALLHCAWELGCLVVEGELTEALARKAYWEAATGTDLTPEELEKNPQAYWNAPGGIFKADGDTNRAGGRVPKPPGKYDVAAIGERWVSGFTKAWKEAWRS